MTSAQETIVVDAAVEILAKAGFRGDVAWHQEAPFPRLAVTSEDSRLLIGNSGEHLEALEQLIRLVAFRRMEGSARTLDFYLDVNGYRKTHHESLLASARQSAERVASTGRAEALIPMNAQERKIVHTQLASYTQVQTESIGTEPNRRIVIKRVSL